MERKSGFLEQKNKKHTRSDRTRRFWTKAHYMDSTGIVGAIRQTLKDKELQHWMSEMNNNIKRDTDQNSKMRTYSTENSKQQKITNGHQYLPQNN